MLTYSYLQYKQERKKTYLHRQQQVHFVSNTRVPIQVRLVSGPVNHSLIKNKPIFLFFAQSSKYVYTFICLIPVEKVVLH